MSEQQPQPNLPPKRTSTTFFRVVNFELFASHHNPVTRVMTFVGSGVFLGLIGYFWYNERQAAKEYNNEDENE